MAKSHIQFINEPKNLRKILNLLYDSIIGKNLKFKNIFGEKLCIYADFTSTSRACFQIEKTIKHHILSSYSNIYSTENLLSEYIGEYKNEANITLREYINADINKDKIIYTGQETNSAMNKLISIIHLKEYGQFYLNLCKLKNIYSIFMETNQQKLNVLKKLDNVLLITSDFQNLFPCTDNTNSTNIFEKIGNLYSDGKQENLISKLMDDYENFKPLLINFQIDNDNNDSYTNNNYNNNDYDNDNNNNNKNLLSWLNEGIDIIKVKSYSDLNNKLNIYSNRYIKIGIFTVASNVTGNFLDVDYLAVIMHCFEGMAFFDYDTGGPYLKMDMNSMLPEDYRKKLGFSNKINYTLKSYCYKDGLFFSPHKFLGGNNTSNVLVCKKNIFLNRRHRHDSNSSIKMNQEVEENDTHNSINEIRIGLTLKLKNVIRHSDVVTMNSIINDYVINKLKNISNLKFINDFSKNTPTHIPIYSFLITYNKKYFHYNYITRLLNDLFGIQASSVHSNISPCVERLLKINGHKNKKYILNQLEYYYTTNHQTIFKPGFTRLNFPFFYPKFIIDYIIYAIKFIALNASKYFPFYTFDITTGSYFLNDQLTNSKFNKNSIISFNRIYKKMKKNCGLGYENKFDLGYEMNYRKGIINDINFHGLRKILENTIHKINHDMDLQLFKKKLMTNGGEMFQTRFFDDNSEHFRWFLIVDDIRDIYLENNKTFIYCYDQNAIIPNKLSIPSHFNKYNYLLIE